MPQFVTCGRRLLSLVALIVPLQVTWVISSRWETAFPKCAWTSAAAIGSTSLCETVSSLCFWPVVINLRKPPISGGLKNWQRRFKHEPDFDYFRYGGTAGQ